MLSGPYYGLIFGVSYAVEVQPAALKALAKLPRGDRERVAARIDGLATDPRPAGCTKLSGVANAWRIRSGNYRIVYTIDDAIRIVTVTRVGHRRDVYRRR